MADVDVALVDSAVMTDDQIDVLPDDLNPAGFVGAYLFPDNSRRPGRERYTWALQQLLHSSTSLPPT